MKLGPDIYYLNNFNIQNMSVSINGRVGMGAIKNQPENAIKLRESSLLHHLKPIQITPNRRGFFHCYP